MDQQVIDTVRQHLSLPYTVTDDEIAQGLDGSFLVERIEMGIAVRELKKAVLDAAGPLAESILDGLARIGRLTQHNDV